MTEPLRRRAADLRDGIRLALRDLDRLEAEARAARPRLTPEASRVVAFDQRSRQANGRWSGLLRSSTRRSCRERLGNSG